MSDCLKDIRHDNAFDLLTDAQLELLEQNKTTIHYKKGEIVFKQGSIASTILFGKTGLFKLYMEGVKKDIILSIKKEGTFLGLSNLYYINKTHLYSVAALQDSTVDIYDKMVFKTVLNENAAFSNEIVKYINHNSARIFNRFLCVSDKNARGKVADMLLCFSKNIYESPHYTLVMSRQELSDFVGLSMENTIRILKEFESDGLIEMKGKDIKINDFKILDKISEFG